MRCLAMHYGITSHRRKRTFKVCLKGNQQAGKKQPVEAQTEQIRMYTIWTIIVLKQVGYPSSVNLVNG